AGVNLLLAPDLYVSLSQAGALSPASRCRVFDAAADGYVRSEGVAALVLTRRADADADGHRIIALIEGSAVNHDGHAAGLTVPSGPAQEAVLRAALADAGVDASAVDLLEAHGTGTALGDPIEVEAAARVYGPSARGRALAVTAIKARVGHLESAAGLAGVLSATLALEHGRFPANPGLETINPRLGEGARALNFVRESVAWPRPAGAP
ncbi:MAG: polyketide synthase, partial [Pseudomonadales bacterium]|nr:polyketide synthase [Pseudomonadales bacterium]